MTGGPALLRRVTHAAIWGVIVGVEMGWLATFAYGAYLFVF